MGGRDLPYECEHGKVMDWGDFGPDSNDGTVGAEKCAACDEERTLAAAARREAIARALYDYFNPMGLNSDVDIADMRHAADAALTAIAEAAS